MADLSCTIAGISSPNPFWLASAPPTDKQYNVERAFEAGWGGVVWKTLGEDGPPVVNVSSRYGSVDFEGHRSDKNVKKALSQLEEMCKYLKVVGSYPV